MDGFFTPPDHVKFQAKKLFGKLGEIVDGAIAYLEQEGGGPREPHKHAHDHLFFVMEGRVRVLLGQEETIIEKGGISARDGQDSPFGLERQS